MLKWLQIRHQSLLDGMQNVVPKILDHLVDKGKIDPLRSEVYQEIMLDTTAPLQKASQAARLACNTATRRLLVIPARHSPRSSERRSGAWTCSLWQGDARPHGACEEHVLAGKARSDELSWRTQGTRATAENLPVEGQVADERRTCEGQDDDHGQNLGQHLPFVIGGSEEGIWKAIVQLSSRPRTLWVPLLKSSARPAVTSHLGGSVQSEERRWGRSRQGNGFGRCRMRQIGVLHSQSAVWLGQWRAVAAVCASVLFWASRQERVAGKDTPRPAEACPGQFKCEGARRSCRVHHQPPGQSGHRLWRLGWRQCRWVREQLDVERTPGKVCRHSVQPATCRDNASV